MKKKPLGNYGLSIVLFTLFVASWIGQTYAGWYRYIGEQKEHGSTPTLFGQSGYFFEWSAATLENWQSEFLQLLAFVILTAAFIHKGSHESKDTDEEQHEMLTRIEERLAKIEDQMPKPTAGAR